jgi:3-hydroxyacyl-CoA dehydrogenase/enoyl-CoA hydratase/3-hydroxybutyryl-CoA epimerase
MALYQSASLWVREQSDGVAVLLFDPSGKVSRLTREFIADIHAALDAIDGEPRIRAMLLRSLKPGRFLQGLDIPGWKALHASGELAAWVDAGQALWNRLQQLRVPTIAWVNGMCLGAGFDLALACDHLVLVDRPGTVIGFSEADVGLIPSWGGLGTLVHRMGLQDGIPFALAGRRMGAKEASERGIADRIADTDEPDVDAEIELAAKRDPEAWNRRTWRQQFLERFERGRRLLYRRVERLHSRRLPDDLPAPRLALEVIKSFAEQGHSAGQAAARKSMSELEHSPAFKNLIRLHELREAATPVACRTALPLRERTVAILGASPFGMQLLRSALRQGAQVILRETDELRLGTAVLKLVQDLGHEIQAGALSSKGTQNLLGRIRNTSAWKYFDTADFVIDARELIPNLAAALAEIDAQTKPDVPVITVGVAGSLGDAARNCGHPERFAGILAPAPLGSSLLVEWRRGPGMNDSNATSIRDWLGGLGWIPLETADAPGLLLTRLLVPIWNELIAFLREGARVEMVDDVLLQFGLGRGPFEYLDHIGLAAAHRLVEAVSETLSPRIAIDPFWSDVLLRGWRGQSGGKGFYRYRRGRRQANDLLENWLHQEGPVGGPVQVAEPKQLRQQLRDRVVFLTINEAFRCLDEKRVASADDLDLATMLVDWAPHRGGPIRYARDLGIGDVVSRLRELSVHGDRYHPCPRLLVETEAIKKST